MSKRLTCSICGCEIEGFGNNPWPLWLGEDDRCCDSCNSRLVVPARIAGFGSVVENVLDESRTPTAIVDSLRSRGLDTQMLEFVHRQALRARLIDIDRYYDAMVAIYGE